MFSEYELNILQNANICTKDGWYEIIQNLSSARYSNYVPSTNWWELLFKTTMNHRNTECE